MFSGTTTQIEKRILSLEKHLKRENPTLLGAVRSFRDLDRVAYRMGLLSPEESFATKVPWWPLVAVLGTFSSGKSTFINTYLGHRLQRTGNQAVDDKFTVVCFSKEDQVHTLPGLALDADPRFPFYQISEEINLVENGEGQRIDAYLQLKTCPSERLRGKIIIDSPGFDADDQRTSTLRITSHIIDLSDLVLVFFDARHPEPGAMQDTLRHLVKGTIHRPDSNKFMFILNQIDTAAQEDNPEEVVAAWQRALASTGLTAGRFYQVYDKDAARPIDDEALRLRFEGKRDTDMADIYARIQQVEIERAYRVVGVLENTVRRIEEQAVPKLIDLLRRWRRTTLILDGVLFVLLGGLGLYLWLTTSLGLGTILDTPWLLYSTGGALFAGTLYLHHLMRKVAARRVVKQLEGEIKDEDFLACIKRAFLKNTSHWYSVFSINPAGWGRGTRKRLMNVLADTDQFVQNLNDQFTNPSGKEPEKK